MNILLKFYLIAFLIFASTFLVSGQDEGTDTDSNYVSKDLGGEGTVLITITIYV